MPLSESTQRAIQNERVGCVGGASRRKLVRFIFEEMKGELLLCDEAWELENGPGNHLLLIDRCLKNQVRKRNKEVEAESDRLLRHR